jgi:hypothetical protein
VFAEESLLGHSLTEFLSQHSSCLSENGHSEFRDHGILRLPQLLLLLLHSVSCPALRLRTYFLTYLLTYLTPWCRVLLEKLIGFQLVTHFMEPEGSLPHTQVLASCPYPDPTQSSPYPHIPLPEDPS